MTAIFNHKGKVVGNVEGNTLYKSIQASKHFLRKPPAISNDVVVIQQAEDLGAKFVDILETESSLVYRAELSTIKFRGIPIDRGHGKQLALTFDYWDIIV